MKQLSLMNFEDFPIVGFSSQDEIYPSLPWHVTPLGTWCMGVMAAVERTREHGWDRDENVPKVLM